MDSIFDLLEYNGYLSPSAVGLLRGYCERWQVTGYQAIVESHLLSEDALADALSESLKIDRLFHVCFNAALIRPEESISYALACRWCCIETDAIRQFEGREFALADPTERSTIVELRRMFGRRVRVAVAPASEIKRAIWAHYPLWEQIHTHAAQVASSS
ncbi:MAG: hypothetical protein OXT67_09060 [Zetaproteobacteria bacterium]|nr:hypothetical protein [Zetaproteobacteria bacterium]